MQQIKIVKQSCDGFPMIWDVILQDGSAGYIKYQSGIISLKPLTEKPGIYQQPIIEEKIGDEHDGVLSLEDALRWLEDKGYQIIS